MISSLSKAVVDATGSIVQNNKAVVGANAFLHEAGIHQAGVLNNAITYEIMNPEKYGIFQDNIVIGIHSGKNAIIKKMQDLGYDVNKYDISEIVKDIKDFFEYNKEMKEDDFTTIVDINRIVTKKIG